MNSAESSPARAQLAKAACVPIASLDPSQPPPAEKSIKGVISLLWPYSSSHRAFAYLLAEPDFRLRSKKGQIRIQLKGITAVALAETHVGIGDYIHLSLAGSQWVEEDVSSVKTPGHSVDADLAFGSKIFLQIERDGKQLPILDVDRTESPPLPSPLPDTTPLIEPQTPRDNPKPAVWSGSSRTPARLYTGSGTERPFTSSYGLYWDDDALDERPTKHARVFRSSGNWRLVDENSSSSEEDISKPVKNNLPQLDGAAEISDIFDAPVEAAVKMGLPKLPQIQTDIDTAVYQTTQTNSQHLSTPESPSLRPIASAVLPQVSPLSAFQDSSTLHIDLSRTEPREEIELQPEHGSLAGGTEPEISTVSADGSASAYTSFNQNYQFVSQNPLSNDIHGTVGERTEEPELERKEAVKINLGAKDEQDRRGEKSIVQENSYEPVLLEAKEPVCLVNESFLENSESVPERGGYGLTDTSPDLVPDSQEQVHPDPDDLYSQPESIGVVSQSILAPEAMSSKAVGKSQAAALETGHLTPEASQDYSSQLQRSIAIEHRVDDILDGRLPLTPQSSAIPLHMLEPAEPTNTLQTLVEGDEAKMLPSSSRRSSDFRSSEVPKVISMWFTSRRPMSLQDEQTNQTDVVLGSKGILETPARSSRAIGFDFSTAFETHQLGRSQTDESLKATNFYESLATSTGSFRTAMSYYSSLSSLDRHVNASSQTGQNLVDVIAVVTSPTAQSQRAKSGPKHFYTYLNVLDSSSFPETLQVQVFRPFKASLPKADVGDVILLRNFSVKSRDRKCFLLSREASAWCVWRNKNYAQEREDKDTPIWARRKIDDAEASYEECKGPPVELGSEERQYAFGLRTWWESLQAQNFDAGNDQKDPIVRGIAVDPVSNDIARLHT